MPAPILAALLAVPLLTPDLAPVPEAEVPCAFVVRVVEDAGVTLRRELTDRTDVVAVDDGCVAEICRSACDAVVRIEHGGLGFETVTMFPGHPRVEEGEAVAAGQVIGTMLPDESGEPVEVTLGMRWRGLAFDPARVPDLVPPHLSDLTRPRLHLGARRR